MKTAVIHPKSQESAAANATKPFFARSAESRFAPGHQPARPFFSGLQTKLTLGQPGDRYEREADATADAVVQRLRNPALPAPAVGRAAVTPPVQAKCAACEEELQAKEEPQIREAFLQRKSWSAPPPPPKDSIQRQCGACAQEESLARKEDPHASPTVASGFQSQLNASKGSGSPLPNPTRQRMEASFGADFGGVRVHHGATAVQMSRDLNAQAFTHGGDIYFNEGKYSPATTTGQHLLAHELTHTIQQGASPAPSLQADFFDDVGEAYDSAVETVTSAGEAVVDTATSVGEAVVDAATSVGGAVVDAATSVAKAAYQAGGEAVDWIATQAGQAALAAANGLAGLFGGTVTVSGTDITIAIPKVSLFDRFQEELGEELPAIPLFAMPVFGGSLGPIAFLATLEVNATPSLLAAIGPGELRNIRVSLDPLAGTFAGHAELYVATALGSRLTLFGGIVGRGLGVIPMEPPIPLEASLEGGVRGTGTGWNVGAISSALDVAYHGGAWRFNADNNLMLGVLLQGDVDLYAAAKLFEFLVCDYAYPLGHWEAGEAWNVNIPVGVGGGGPPSVGPVTTSPVPIDDIETAIEPLQYGLNCQGLREIIAGLCENQKLPEVVCDVLLEADLDDDGGLDIDLLSLRPCEELPEKYAYSSYNAAEQELKRRAGLPAGTRLYRNEKRATSGPCVRIGRHYNVWDNPGKRGEPVGAIGMCPCTTRDQAGNEQNVQRYAVLNPYASLAPAEEDEIDPVIPVVPGEIPPELPIEILVSTPSGEAKPTKGRCKGKTVKFGDSRNKHTKVAQHTADELHGYVTEAKPPKGELGKFWEAARNEKKGKIYGSQLGSQVIPSAEYRKLVEKALNNWNGSSEDPCVGNAEDDAGFDLGIDISKVNRPKKTAHYKVFGIRDDASGSAHIIPE